MRAKNNPADNIVLVLYANDASNVGLPSGAHGKPQAN
jgi:hypothetical protein